MNDFTTKESYVKNKLLSFINKFQKNKGLTIKNKNLKLN